MGQKHTGETLPVFIYKAIVNEKRVHKSWLPDVNCRNYNRNLINKL